MDYSAALCVISFVLVVWYLLLAGVIVHTSKEK